jgi:hypothetical protein
LRLLHRTSARNDRRPAPLGEKLIEREVEAALAAVGIDGRLRIVRRHQGRDGRGADALGPRLAGEFLLPGVEAGGGTAALRGVGLRGCASQRGQGEEGGGRNSLALGHQEIPRLAALLDRGETLRHAVLEFQAAASRDNAPAASISRRSQPGAASKPFGQVGAPSSRNTRAK